LPKLRVGIVNFLNSKPLAWGFLKGHHADLFAPSYHPPALVARLLGQGNLDIGLIPSIEVQRIPNLRVLPDMCVAARHEVRSVLLVSRGPVEEIRRVALDQNSRTSATLVRILLRERYGLDPEYLHERPDPERMLGEADAALIIGDPAMKIPREQFRVFDLATLWHEFTGFGFVFAMWMARRNDFEKIRAVDFALARDEGLAHLNQIAADCAGPPGLTEDEVKDYLTKNIVFSVTDDMSRGLNLYFELAHKHMLVDEKKELKFLT